MSTDDKLISAGFVLAGLLAVIGIPCAIYQACRPDPTIVGKTEQGVLHEIRHGGKVYLILRRDEYNNHTATKLDEWPDTQSKEAGQ